MWTTQLSKLYTQRGDLIIYAINIISKPTLSLKVKNVSVKLLKKNKISSQTRPFDGLIFSTGRSTRVYSGIPDVNVLNRKHLSVLSEFIGFGFKLCAWCKWMGFTQKRHCSINVICRTVNHHALANASSNYSRRFIEECKWLCLERK